MVKKLLIVTAMVKELQILANHFDEFFFAILDRIWPNNFLKMNLIYSKNFFMIASLRLFM